MNRKQPQQSFDANQAPTEDAAKAAPKKVLEEGWAEDVLSNLLSEDDIWAGIGEDPDWDLPSSSDWDNSFPSEIAPSDPDLDDILGFEPEPPRSTVVPRNDALDDILMPAIETGKTPKRRIMARAKSTDPALDEVLGDDAGAFADPQKRDKAMSDLDRILLDSSETSTATGPSQGAKGSPRTHDVLPQEDLDRILMTFAEVDTAHTDGKHAQEAFEEAPEPGDLEDLDEAFFDAFDIDDDDFDMTLARDALAERRPQDDPFADIFADTPVREAAISAALQVTPNLEENKERAEPQHSARVRPLLTDDSAEGPQNDKPQMNRAQKWWARLF